MIHTYAIWLKYFVEKFKINNLFSLEIKEKILTTITYCHKLNRRYYINLDYFPIHEFVIKNTLYVF